MKIVSTSELYCTIERTQQATRKMRNYKALIEKNWMVRTKEKKNRKTIERLYDSKIKYMNCAEVKCQ